LHYSGSRGTIQSASGPEVGELVQKLAHVFCSLSQTPLEFTKLVEVIETKGLKILNKVHTRWISLLKPLKRISGEYKTLIVEFAQDTHQESTTRKNLSLLCDVSTLLALLCILPLLESINSFIKFAQVGDVFVSDMIAAMKICQAEIYMMYCDSATSF
jgi:hypothetical protein